MTRAAVTYAHKINEGDQLIVDGRLRRIDKIRRAQGRKPAQGGENLFVTVGDQRLLVNSLTPVRVVRCTYEIPLTTT